MLPALKLMEFLACPMFGLLLTQGSGRKGVQGGGGGYRPGTPQKSGQATGLLCRRRSQVLTFPPVLP